MNKKGGDKVISVYWFFIMFLVAAAVVYMVFLFYGKPYDVREVEANLLASKISDCLAFGGMVNEQVFYEEYSADFMNNCKIDIRAEDSFGWNDDQIYYRVTFYSFDPQSLIVSVNPKFTFSSEKYQWVDSCNSNKDGNPFCVNKEFYALGSGGESYFVDVFTGVRKTEKNVR